MRPAPEYNPSLRGWSSIGAQRTMTENPTYPPAHDRLPTESEQDGLIQILAGANDGLIVIRVNSTPGGLGDVQITSTFDSKDTSAFLRSAMREVKREAKK